MNKTTMNKAAMNKSTTDDNEFLKLALRLATEAGTLISQQRHDLTLSYKADTELVTQADVAADTLIVNGIRSRYPDHAILSEELNPNQLTDAEHLWIIDPIDGTVNFAHQHSQVAVSIAYYFKGKAQVGVVHNPFTGETFYACKGMGAYINDTVIQCAKTNELRRALIATGFPYVKDHLPKLMRRLETVLTQCADIRRIGSAALDICWVACGRLDGYYESVQPWDFAAAQLIAREAGAQFGHIHPLPEFNNPELQGEDIIVCVPELFDQLQSLLEQADKA